MQPPSSPSVTAMDLTAHDKLVFSAQSSVNFLGKSTDSPQRGWVARFQSDNVEFSPSRILLGNASDSTLLLSPSRKNVISIFDTERGTPVRSTTLFNRAVDDSLTMPVADLTPLRKFEELQPEKTLEHVAISGNMLFRLRQDLRVDDKVFAVAERAEAPGKSGERFTCVATTGDGNAAVGTNTGVVKLYRVPEDMNDPWKRATTNLNQLAGAAPVTGVDVTRDGDWLVWTTDEFIVFTTTLFIDKNGDQASGFIKSIPVDERRPVMILKLDDEIKRKNRIGNVRFSPAKFDRSCHRGGHALEECVVTTTGGYVISWNMRRLKNDFAKKRDDRSETEVVPSIVYDAEKPSDIMLSACEYGDADSVVIATMASDLERIHLGHARD